MPNNMIVDVSRINSLIAATDSMRNNLNKTYVKIATADAAFATINAGQPQVKMYANTITSFKAVTATKGVPTATATVKFNEVGFTTSPIVTATLVGKDIQNVNVWIQSADSNSATILVAAVGNNKATLNAGPIQVNVIAIGL